MSFPTLEQYLARLYSTAHDIQGFYWDSPHALLGNPDSSASFLPARAEETGQVAEF